MPSYNNDPESLAKATTEDDQTVYYDPNKPKTAWVASDTVVSAKDML